MGDVEFMLKQQQLQRAMGELRALYSMYGDPAMGTHEKFRELRTKIERFIEELEDCVG